MGAFFYIRFMVEFEPDTIVRKKYSGEFGKIVKRCICGNGQTPIHYEVLVESKREDQYHVVVINHSELEFECAPKEPTNGVV